MNSNVNRDIEVYEKIETLCKRIESYTTKTSTVKNSVKTSSYAQKVKRLLEMINYSEGNKKDSRKVQEEQEDISRILELVSEEEIKASIYDPNSANFCYKDRLDRANGDISILLEELKQEDTLGYRNAYVINEIKKCMDVQENITSTSEQVEVQANVDIELNEKNTMEQETEISTIKELTVEKIEEVKNKNVNISGSQSFISVETVESKGVLHGFFETEITPIKSQESNISIQQEITENNVKKSENIETNKTSENLPIISKETSFWDEIVGAIKSVIQSIKDIFKSVNTQGNSQTTNVSSTTQKQSIGEVMRDVLKDE